MKENKDKSKEENKRDRLIWTGIIIFILLLVLIGGLFYLSISRRARSESVPSENGTITVCFTQQEDCKKPLLELLGQSYSFKAALYDLDDPDLIRVIKEKKTNADILVDEDNYEGLGEKISTPGLMHNKFWIADTQAGSYVVTGSMNPTYNDISKNSNNMIMIRSNTLSKNYLAEFDELKKNAAQKRTQITKVNISGTIVENYFCPEDNCEDQVIAQLKTAKMSIKFMTFSFTSDRIGQALLEKGKEIEISGVFDKSQLSSERQYSEYPKLLDAGMDVKVENMTGKLHHKVFIVDGSVVVSGSYNPTASGNSKNEENFLIIHNATIAKMYEQEFTRIRNYRENVTTQQ